MAENPVLKERYRLIEQLGTGGMAVIYRAQDLELQRTVAVKVLRPNLVADQEFVERFKREARSAANLSHPNIVTIHDVGQDGPKTHYIVMEHVEGQNLKQLIRSRGAFDVDAALSIIIEVCKGVGYAHRAGLVHCDLKPQNILVTPENKIKVVDFGIARAFTAYEPGQKDELVWGSPHYFAPEQAQGAPPTPSSDVYSVGVVLFELLTGRLPFPGTEYNALALAHIQDPPPSIKDIDPALPSELARIVDKVLGKEPSSRYRTADQFGRILKTYLDKGVEPTGSFVVTPSDGYQQPEPPQDTIPAASPVMPPPQAPPPSYSVEHTVPSLPPLDVGAAMHRARESHDSSVRARGAAPAPAAYSPAEDYEMEDEFIPGVDIENIILGILAAVAVLGLIPLSLTVFLTLTR